MVSASWSVTGRESALGVLGRWLRRRQREVSAFLAVAMRFVLMVGGLAAVTYGVFQASHVAGWIVGGLALLVVEAMVKRR